MVTQFKSGAIRDSQDGKVDFVETISFTAHERYARYMTGKKKKYGEGNFKKGIPIESYEQSLLRHVDKYFRNKYENGNDEKNEDHLSAMRFNLDGIMHEEEKVRKTYISGKITDPDPEVQQANLQRFDEVEALFNAQGIQCFNPADSEKENKDWTYEQYLTVDVVYIIQNKPNMYFMKDWEQSRGARLEHEIAKQLGLKITYEK